MGKFDFFIPKITNPLFKVMTISTVMTAAVWHIISFGWAKIEIMVCIKKSGTKYSYPFKARWNSTRIVPVGPSE